MNKWTRKYTHTNVIVFRCYQNAIANLDRGQVGTAFEIQSKPKQFIKLLKRSKSYNVANLDRKLEIWFVNIWHSEFELIDEFLGIANI